MRPETILVGYLETLSFWQTSAAAPLALGLWLLAPGPAVPSPENPSKAMHEAEAGDLKETLQPLGAHNAGLGWTGPLWSFFAV